VRLFLAIDLPAELREELAGLQARLRAGCAGWRWVRPQGIHLTLRFLGEVEPARDAACRAAWREAVAPLPPFRAELGGIGSFPPRGRPRVLWVGVVEPGPGGLLQELARRLERAARDCGFEPERRPFSPHLTLARAARGGGPAPPPAVERASGRIAVERVQLFLSELHPAGARYTALDSFDLEGGRERA